jgi:hypothetical protein
MQKRPRLSVKQPTLEHRLTYTESMDKVFRADVKITLRLTAEEIQYLTWYAQKTHQSPSLRTTAQVLCSWALTKEIRRIKRIQED